MLNTDLYRVGVEQNRDIKLRNCTSANTNPNRQNNNYLPTNQKRSNIKIGNPRRQKLNYQDKLLLEEKKNLKKYEKLTKRIMTVKNDINDYKTKNKTIITKILSSESEKKKLVELKEKIDDFLKSNNEDKKKISYVV